MTIKQWLNSSKNFDIGVALYNTYGTESLLKNMFAQGFSETRAKRLFEELLLLKEADLLYQPEIKSELQNVNVATAMMPEQTVPEAKDPYRSKWMLPYQEMNMLRHSLETIPDDKQRGVTAFRILELEKICMSIWDQRDYFLRTGSEIGEESQHDPFIDINELQKRIYAVRTYISKYSKPPVTEKKTTHLERYRKELESLLKQQANL